VFVNLPFTILLYLLVSSVEPLIELDVQYQYAIHNREEDFYALFQNLRQAVRSEIGGLQSLKMSVVATDENQPTINLALRDIQVADTVDQALLVLYQHCDFLNYGVLCHICNHLGNQQCQQIMGSYIKESENLKQFKLRVFMRLWRGIRRVPPHDISKLTSRQKKNWDDYTINDALCVKGLICEKASVPSQLIRLKSIHGHSNLVSLVWLMPHSVANSLKQNMSDRHGDEEFQQLAIHQLIVDGDPVYNAVTDQVL